MIRCYSTVSWIQHYFSVISCFIIFNIDSRKEHRIMDTTLFFIYFNFGLFCVFYKFILVEESRLDREKAENKCHQSVTSVNDGW